MIEKVPAPTPLTASAGNVAVIQQEDLANLLLVKKDGIATGQLTEEGITWLLSHPEVFDDISHFGSGNESAGPIFANAA